MYDKPRFLAGGDKAFFIEFGNAVAPALQHRVQRLMLVIRSEIIPGLVEAIPTYRSLLIHYDPLQTSFKELKDKLESLEQRLEDSEFPKPKVTEIPAVYGGEYGPDLEFVAKHNGLTPEEVVQIHTSTTYLIYMIGFLPGQPYLGGMSSRIATPRLETPRSKVLRGSVGIAGNLTGIYAVESPGGWQIIGRTPVRLFDPNKEPPALLQAGDYVTFVRITPQEYDRTEEMVQQGTYKVTETQMA